MTDDITFCGNDCDNKKCLRHRSNIKEPQYPHSVALLEGTEYCEKKSTLIDLNEVKAIAEEAEQGRPQGDLISRSALLERVDEERQYLLARGQTGAEHILVHNFRDLIDNAPAVDVISNDEGYEMYGKGYLQGYKRGSGESKIHGKWIDRDGNTSYPFWERYECSECHKFSDNTLGFTRRIIVGRLIDADELKNAIRRYTGIYDEDLGSDFIYLARLFELIDNQPTTNERPQGGWVKDGVGLHKYCDSTGTDVLQELPQYHFDRNEFVSTFEQVFTNDEILELEDMCQKYTTLNAFLLFYNPNWEEFYIIHLPSGTIINWYKHLGRTNTCNKENFSIADLKNLLERLKTDMGRNNEVKKNEVN